jgi:hypothetical protein
MYRRGSTASLNADKMFISKAQQRVLKEVVSTVQITIPVRIPTLSYATRRQSTSEQTTLSHLAMQISGEMLLTSKFSVTRNEQLLFCSCDLQSKYLICICQHYLHLQRRLDMGYAPLMDFLQQQIHK